MRLEFDLNNNVEMPEIILGKRNYEMLGSITNIDNLIYEYNLMSVNSVSFTVYKELNSETERLWDEIKDRRAIWLKEFNEWFQIDVVINDEMSISKQVTATSLCEAELSQIYIKSTEINTENDIARDDYKNPTVFYKPSNPKESLLHRLLKVVPNYSIKHVDDSLYNIQRTFSIDGTSVYDALTGEIAEEIGCLFLFDSTDRSISVYDLKTNCNHCGHRGDFTDICPECESTDLDYGYGHDTTIFVDSETLAENISLSGKQDEVKNYIKISGGDDNINTAIAACNPSGTQYIYAFSDRDREDMSDELSSKLEEYQKEYDRLAPSYQNIMKDLYNAIDEELKLEFGMMPDITTAETNAEEELAKLTSANLSPVAVTDVSIASVYTVNNAVLEMAKCIVNSTVYKIELIENSTSFANQIWKGKFRLTNRSDENDSAENTSYIQLTINDDYAYYVEQKIRKSIDRNDIYLVDMFDIKTDLNIFKNELKKYCLNRLTSFESAYQSVIDVLTNAGCANNSIYGDIYNDLYLPYYNKLTAIQEEIKVRDNEIEAVEEKLAELEKSQTEITEYLNLEHFLGESLWKELCSFRREDNFENSNYISDGLDNNELLEKAQELLEKAKNDAITASTLQMSLSTTMFNLLAIPEFKKLTGMFEGGNWIRIGLDNKVYRLRLIHYKIDFSNIQNIEVEFSDVTQTANGLNDIKSLMGKVSSMATNFNYIAHQAEQSSKRAEQGSNSFSELDKIRNDGLNASLYSISNSVNQEFVIDSHGIIGRQWDDVIDGYLPEQVKFTNNCLVFTDDYWQTAKTALGKIKYHNPVLNEDKEKYGLLADAVIAGILMGNDIIGGNIYSKNYSLDTGTYFNLNNGDFSFAGGKLVYDSSLNKMTLKGVTIEWETTTTPSIENISGLSETINSKADKKSVNDLNTKIIQILQGEYTTSIGEDYIISPHIGGGYLHISGSKGSSVTIDPAQIKNSSYIFAIKNSSDNLVMWVDTEGDGYFKGNIEASSGNIGGFTITASSIYKTNNLYGSKSGIYLGTNGLSITDKFKVSSSGNLMATSVDLSGKITATSGTIGKWEVLSNGGLMSETSTGTAPGTLNRLYLQPFTKSDYENTWVISSQHADIDSSGNVSDTLTAYWRITGDGYFYTEGDIYTEQDIQVSKKLILGTWVQPTYITAESDADIRFYTYGKQVFRIEQSLVTTSGQGQFSGSTYPQIYGNGSYLHLNYGNYYNYGLIIEKESIRPAGDGYQNLGASSYRWSTIYSSSPSISTSDKNEKNTINELDKALALKFIMGLKPVSYKYNNGTSVRTHTGLISQDIEELLCNLGLDSSDFAGFIKSPKIEITQTEKKDDDGNVINDENGNPIVETKEHIIENEFTYGLRYEEFISPIIKVIQMQQREIEALKQSIHDKT